MSSSVFRIRLQKWTIYGMVIAIALATATILSVTVFAPKQEQVSQPFIASSLVVGKPAPDFTLKSLDGSAVTLSSLRGHPVLINFWASWCVPCREEMPELVRSYDARKAEGLVILGVNLTNIDTLSDVQVFVKEFKVDFPVLLDEDGTVNEKIYRVPGIPTSVFIDRDGLLRRIQIGKMTGQQVDQYVEEILK